MSIARHATTYTNTKICAVKHVSFNMEDLLITSNYVLKQLFKQKGTLFTRRPAPPLSPLENTARAASNIRMPPLCISQQKNKNTKFAILAQTYNDSSSSKTQILLPQKLPASAPSWPWRRRTTCVFLLYFFLSKI